MLVGVCLVKRATHAVKKHSATEVVSDRVSVAKRAQICARSETSFSGHDPRLQFLLCDEKRMLI